MTDMDVLKLQKAYGCNGACGGWAKSETGGLSSIIASYNNFFFFGPDNPTGMVKNEQNNVYVSGDLDGTSSDNESPCEWILETSPGKVGRQINRQIKSKIPIT